MSEKMSEKRLKNCPFCGGEAESHMTIAENYIDRPDGQILWFVECANEDCCASSGVHDTPEEAVKAWNTRKPMEKIVERLEEGQEESYKLYAIGFNAEDRGGYDAYSDAIDIVKEEGGLND